MGDRRSSAFLAAAPLALSVPQPRQTCRRNARCAKRRRADRGAAPPSMCAPSPDREAEFVLDGSDASTSSSDLFDWNAWRASGTPAEIPMLPFAPEDIFLPGEVKRLHLVEARFLALFERVVVAYDKKFAHVLFASDRAALAAYGTIVRVRTWRRLEVGVYLEIEGLSRFRVSKLERAAPFWAGTCRHVDDASVAADARAAVWDAETRVWGRFREVLSLCARLDEDPARQKADPAARTLQEGVVDKEVPPPPSLAGSNGLFFLSGDAKIAMWESSLKMAARRAGNDERFEFGGDEGDAETRMRRARAVSFAGFDFFPSTAAERQKALEGMDTLARLENVVKGLEMYGRSLAAKAAVQDAFRKDGES